MRPPASPINRVLFILSKKLLLQRKEKEGEVEPTQIPFRESMIDLHGVWYETEEEWRKFLSAVKSRKQSSIHDKLIDAAIKMLELAASVYQGPLTYEASCKPENLRALVEESSCPECGHQGDLIAILPHPKQPQWKLSCGECGNTWVTGQDKVEPLFDDDEDD